GYPPRPEALRAAVGRLTNPGSAVTASMLGDVERRGWAEADHIFGDLLPRRGVAGGGGSPLPGGYTAPQGAGGPAGGGPGGRGGPWAARTGRGGEVSRPGRAAGEAPAGVLPRGQEPGRRSPEASRLRVTQAVHTGCVRPVLGRARPVG